MFVDLARRGAPVGLAPDAHVERHEPQSIGRTEIRAKRFNRAAEVRKTGPVTLALTSGARSRRSVTTGRDSCDVLPDAIVQEHEVFGLQPRERPAPAFNSGGDDDGVRAAAERKRTV